MKSVKPPRQSKRGKAGAAAAAASASPVPQQAGEDSTGDSPSKFYDDEENLDAPLAAAKDSAVATGKGASKKDDQSEDEDANVAGATNEGTDDSAGDKKASRNAAKKKNEAKGDEGTTEGKASLVVEGGADDDVSEVAVALAVVGETAATAVGRTATAHATNVSSPGQTSLTDPESPFPEESAFMSTLDSGPSESKIGRKVSRKKGGTAAMAKKRTATKTSAPTADVKKRSLKSSVLGSGKRGAPKAKAAAAPQKRKAKTDPPPAAPKRSRGGNQHGHAAGWSGPPDDVLHEGFTWPEGWTKDLVERKSGASKGSVDAYWYSPGRMYKFRSKAELRRYFAALGEEGVGADEAYKLAVRK